MKAVKTISDLNKDKKTTITRYFEEGVRYSYDFELKYSDGWAQVDTSSDASYYGQWANPITLQYVEFCEGDVTVAKFAAVGEFLEWINNCAKFDSFKGIDTMCNDKITEAFKAIGLENLLH